MDAYSLIITRTVISYVLIIVIFRFMGKREIGELDHFGFSCFYNVRGHCCRCN